MTQVYLVTGGAGSLGRRLVKELLKPQHSASVIRVFDNNENAVARMKRKLTDTRLRWFLGDIRDRDRLVRAMEGVDVCIHLAAQKHVDLGEYNPFFSLQVNVLGTQNCIEAALQANIHKFIFMSSDKAVESCSTYGRCKALSESLTIHANKYKGDFKRTIFSVCRPPNYFGSDGSVIEVWKQQKKEGLPLSVTDKQMFRYFITFDEMVLFLTRCVDYMKGGEIFIPKNCVLHNIYDLARTYSEDIKIVGVRHGERLVELLWTQEEKSRLIEEATFWLIPQE